MDNGEICWSGDRENFNFDSLYELLCNEAHLEEGAELEFGEAYKPMMHALCDSDDILCMMGERASDIAGEYAEDFPDCTKEAIEELDQILKSWFEKHITVNFYGVKNVQKYTVTKEDIIEVHGEICVK